ncbi:hypothetical protein J5N97_025091 [Dioscorea zingiberensis]|uniref:Uncharacterized protein n=1 Tax=Dioscorea zingiberensis TaxID=325984 RepID=A0A9D5C8N2_9LILI|nr:hypothetical protein J5N97_025091 [Dioscorea zingiberensis]
MVARLLKPVGDLVYLAKDGAYYVGYCKAAIRVRRGKRFPTLINYSVLTDKFSVQVDLERGEPPLPWDTPPEKMMAPGGTPGGAGITVGGDRPLKGKTPLRPLGKDHEGTEETNEMGKYGQTFAYAASDDTVQVVQRKFSSFGERAHLLQHETNGGKQSHAEGFDRQNIAIDRVKDCSRSRHVDKERVKSHGDKAKEGALTTSSYAAGKSSEASRNSSKASHMAHSQPHPLTHMKTQISIPKSPQYQVKHTQGPDEGTWQGEKRNMGSINNANVDLNEICDDKINERTTTIKNYSDLGNEETVDTDDEIEDKLVKEIELEMENMWNVDLEWEDDKQEQGVVGESSKPPYLEEIPIENTLEIEPREAEGNICKTYEDIANGSNEPQDDVSGPIESPDGNLK